MSLIAFVPEARIGQSYAVASGLNEGDRIVYEGIQNLKDGAAIKPRAAHFAKARP